MEPGHSDGLMAAVAACAVTLCTAHFSFAALSCRSTAWKWLLACAQWTAAAKKLLIGNVFTIQTTYSKLKLYFVAFFVIRRVCSSHRAHFLTNITSNPSIWLANSPALSCVFVPHHIFPFHSFHFPFLCTFQIQFLSATRNPCTVNEYIHIMHYVKPNHYKLNCVCMMNNIPVYVFDITCSACTGVCLQWIRRRRMATGTNKAGIEPVGQSKEYERKGKGDKRTGDRKEKKRSTMKLRTE